jgi:transposase
MHRFANNIVPKVRDVVPATWHRIPHEAAPPRRKTHTMVAIDETGRKLGEKTVAAHTGGHLDALIWARTAYGVELRWAVEDCRQVSTRLETDLIANGQSIVRVPVKLMTRSRRHARTRGKSDSIDALAVARAALAEPNLPIARHDAVSRELKLLVDRREDLIMQRTAAVNRLRWRVHELDPTRPKSGTLAAAVHRNALREWLAPQSGLVAELARDELADITQFTEAIDELALRIKRRVIQVAPALLALPGVGEITAATIVGETALVGRFSSEAAFARHIGVAPVPHSSGDKAVRFRSTRSGNRQLNKAIHRIAVTQLRQRGLGRAYYDKRIKDGDTAKHALRCLKRRLSRVVFNRLRDDERKRPVLPLAA